MADTTLPGVLLKGVAASRPAANAVAKGTIYSATDTGAITQSDGVSTWSTYATISSGLADPMTTRGDIIVRNASNVTARLARGSADTYLGSDGTDVAFSAVTDAKLSTSDITTNNASTSKHGFAPKYPNDATKYLDGTGAYTVPAGSGGGIIQASRVTLTSGDLTTTSTSFTDATGLTTTLTTGAHRCLVTCAFAAKMSTAGIVAYFDIAVDGTRVGQTGGLQLFSGSEFQTVTLSYLTDVLSAASHTIKVQWKVSSGTGTLLAGTVNTPAILTVIETGLTT